MNVTYCGAHDAVTVLALGRTVKHGESIEVTDELGDQLIAQGWKPTPTPKPAKAVKKENV
jgi:hypothetical protein